MKARRSPLYTVEPTPNRWRVEAKASANVVRTLRRKQDADSLRVLLGRLREDAFGERMVSLREGHELRSLERDPLVRELTRAIRRDPTSAAQIEALLDGLFEDLREGEEFEHTEVVMAVLVALRAAGSPCFEGIRLAFASAQSPEVARLRRFAARLAG